MSNDNNNEKIDMTLPPVVRRLQAGEKTPICIICVGMAGSGKTSLVSRLQASLDEERIARVAQPPSSKEGENDVDQPVSVSSYCVNLDPATLHLPYEVSIDIRDTINYKEVMNQHKLGPNGAIMTSLNLFTTKFDQVMAILERRAYPPPKEGEDSKQKGDEQGEEQDDDNDDDDDDTTPMDYIIVDTPGQIEAFTWSASGSIISESLASAFPTVLCFVVDTVRCASSPNTFMSNMLYACSMLYRTRLPLVVCFNKTDVISHEFCMEWMKDYETFQSALDEVSDSAGFYGSLTRSLSMVLDEFYSNFANACGVSAVTGDGIDQFWKTVRKAAEQDFALDYVEDLKNRIEEQQARNRAMTRSSMRRLQRDLANESG